MKSLDRIILILMAAGAARLHAGPIAAPISFDTLPDLQQVTNQYAGVTFSHATVLEYGISLDELRYPPRSGTKAATDAGGPMVITFALPVRTVEGYFTYRTGLLIQAYDSQGRLIASTRSRVQSNLAGMGVGGSPNELIEVTSDSGISRIVVTGDPGGYSFTLDDLSFGGLPSADHAGPSPVAPNGPAPTVVPEPGTVILAAAGLLAGWFLRRRAKHARACILIFTAATIGSSARAQNPPRPKAVPDVLFSLEPATVTISIKLARDVIPQSVNLIRSYGEGGNQLLGRLSDDGRQADAVAGDGVYTGRFTFSEAAGNNPTLQVSAAYGNEVVRRFSQPVTLRIFHRPPENELLEELGVLDQAGALFEQLRTAGAANASTLVLDFLRRQRSVTAAGNAREGASIWIRFLSGIQGIIAGNPRGTRGVPDSTEDPAVSSSPAAVEPVGNSRALLLSPFSNQFSPYDESDAAAEALSCGDPVVPIRNDAVTVDVMKSLPQYGTVGIVTHGVVDANGDVAIATGEHVTGDRLTTYLGDALTGRVHVASIAAQSYFLITPGFVSYYAADGYPNTMLYVSACLTFGANGDNYTLADAFLNAGAGVYFGWQESVNTDFAASLGAELFRALSDRSAVEEQRSTGTAFTGLQNRRDPNSPHAVFLMRGKGSLVISCPSP